MHYPGYIPLLDSCRPLDHEAEGQPCHPGNTQHPARSRPLTVLSPLACRLPDDGPLGSNLGFYLGGGLLASQDPQVLFRFVSPISFSFPIRLRHQK